MKLETWDELAALPEGSRIKFNHEEAVGSHTGDATGFTVFELGKSGWVVVEDSNPLFVGYGPVPTDAFRRDYDDGDHFTLLSEEEEKAA